MLEAVLLKLYAKRAPGWTLIWVNFDPMQEIGPKVGGGYSFMSGRSFARLQYIILQYHVTWNCFFFFIASTCVKWCVILSIIQPSKQLICETFVDCVSGIRWLKWVLFSAISYYQLLANTKALESRWHPSVTKGDWVANMESRWHPLVTKGDWVANAKLWSRDGTPWLPRETGLQTQNFGVEMAPLGYQGRLGCKHGVEMAPLGYQGRLGCKHKALESRWYPLVTKGDWVANTKL